MQLDSICCSAGLGNNDFGKWLHASISKYGGCVLAVTVTVLFCWLHRYRVITNMCLHGDILFVHGSLPAIDAVANMFNP